MAKRERNGWRDLTYSHWHRTLPRHWHAYDLDLVEVCHMCGRPVLITEVGHLHGRRRTDRTSGKRWLRRMAEAAGVPAVELYYTRDRELTPSEWRAIEEFGRIEWPRPAAFVVGHAYDGGTQFEPPPPAMTPEDWRLYIQIVREGHRCREKPHNKP